MRQEEGREEETVIDRCLGQWRDQGWEEPERAVITCL